MKGTENGKKKKNEKKTVIFLYTPYLLYIYIYTETGIHIHAMFCTCYFFVEWRRSEDKIEDLHKYLLRVDIHLHTNDTIQDETLKFNLPHFTFSVLSKNEKFEHCPVLTCHVFFSYFFRCLFHFFLRFFIILVSLCCDVKGSDGNGGMWCAISWIVGVWVLSIVAELSERNSQLSFQRETYYMWKCWYIEEKEIKIKVLWSIELGWRWHWNEIPTK